MQRFLVDDPVDGDLRMMDYAAPLLSESKLAAAGGSGMDGSTLFDRNVPEQLRQSDDIRARINSASLLLFTLIGQNPMTLNRYGVSLEELHMPNASIDVIRAMCLDSFSQTDTFDGMLQKPPTDLEERYFICHKVCCMSCHAMLIFACRIYRNDKS